MNMNEIYLDKCQEPFPSKPKHECFTCKAVLQPDECGPQCDECCNAEDDWRDAMLDARCACGGHCDCGLDGAPPV
jgi:hypothetical protein